MRRIPRSYNMYDEKIIKKHEKYEHRQEELIKLFPLEQAKQLRKYKSIYVTKDQKFKCMTCHLNSDTYETVDEIVCHQKSHGMFSCL